MFDRKRSVKVMAGREIRAADTRQFSLTLSLSQEKAIVVFFKIVVFKRKSKKNKVDLHNKQSISQGVSTYHIVHKQNTNAVSASLKGS